MEPSEPFMNVKGQMKRLKGRGVLFLDDEDEAMRYLLCKGYYTVINGYKSPFLDKEATGLAGDDRYRERR